MGNGKAVGNFAMSDTVSTRAADRTDAKATLQAVCRQTKRFKETGAPFADLVSRSAGWPSWLARRMPWMFGGSGVDGPGDCAVLSNLGRGDHALESFGSDLPITGLWLLSPFIDPRGSVVAQVAILGVTSVVIEFFVLLAYGALAGRLTSVATRPRFQIVANRVAGGMLVAAGVSVALQGSRRPT